MAAVIRSLRLIGKLPTPSIACLALCDAKGSSSDCRIHRIVDISEIDTFTESMIRRTEYFLGMRRGELELTLPGNSFEVRADILPLFQSDNIVIVPNIATMTAFYRFIENNYGLPENKRTRWEDYYTPAEGTYTAVPIRYVGTLCIRGDDRYGRRSYWKPYKNMPRFHATAHPFLVLTRLLLHHTNVLQYTLPGVSPEMRRMLSVLRTMLHAHIPDNFSVSRASHINAVSVNGDGMPRVRESSSQASLAPTRRVSFWKERISTKVESIEDTKDDFGDSQGAEEKLQRFRAQQALVAYRAEAPHSCMSFTAQ